MTNATVTPTLTTVSTRENVIGIVGGVVADDAPVDLSRFVNGAPHPINLLTEGALEFVVAEIDERGIISLYWESDKTPTQLGVAHTIAGVPGLSKPRVVSGTRTFALLGGIPVAITSGESIEGLPSVGEGQFLISSGITASAAGRLGLTHVVAPGAQVRSRPNAEGRTLVMGCFGFIQ
jgi:hypothetical protein